MKINGFGEKYSKPEDRAIMSRRIPGVGKDLRDAQIAEQLDRTVAGIRERRRVLRLNGDDE